MYSNMSNTDIKIAPVSILTSLLELHATPRKRSISLYSELYIQFIIHVNVQI